MQRERITPAYKARRLQRTLRCTLNIGCGVARADVAAALKAQQAATIDSIKSQLAIRQLVDPTPQAPGSTPRTLTEPEVIALIEARIERFRLALSQKSRLGVPL